MTIVFSAWILLSTPPSDPLGPVSQNPDDVRDAACRLVAMNRVCNPAAPPNTVAPRPTPIPAGGVGFLGLLLWVLLIAVVTTAIWVAVRFFTDRRRSASDLGEDIADPDDDALVGTVIIDRSREPRGWREDAERHRAEGRYRDALRCRYRALVGDLARRGLLDEIPGRTTGEERRQLRVTSPNAVPFFGDAAEIFDGAWYGNAFVDASDDDRFRQLDRDVLANATSMPHRMPQSYSGSPAGGTDR